jgi:F-type H+-transporting ATPase subunit delta
MNVSRAAARVYAKALFDLGVEEKAVGRIHDELHAVHAAFRGLDPELRGFFTAPKLRREDKRRFLDLAFGGKVGRPVLGLLHVLVQKRREPLLNNVVDEFDRYRDQHEGRVQAHVTTARKMDEDLVSALRAALEARTKKSVDLHQKIDPEVLGGIRVNLGDYVLDGTVRRGLMDLRRTLAATHRQG